MDSWNNYNISSYNFMRWFFRLLLLFAITVIVLLFVLKINETVRIREGQVMAADPQVDYIAPFEAEVIRINVREGQAVKKGDTLMLLQNQDLLQQQARIKTEVKYLQDKLASGQRDFAMVRSDYEKQLVLSQESLKKLENDLRKLMVTATVPGIVNFVFNTEKSSNVIDKGDMLVSVAPKSDRYYAKVLIDEKDIPHLRQGMPVRLKMDAYQSLRFGMLSGTITYISERKQENRFFALVELQPESKMPLRSGYTLYGEVVLQQVPLYRYFARKLFQNS
jgi:multidrug resistance efflux pump